MWEVSGYNRVYAQWAIHYSLAYTSWSQFQELKAKSTAGDTLFEKHEGFKDAYRIALGLPITTMTTGRSVPVSPSMTARHQRKTVLSLFRTRTVSGERRYDLRL